MATYSDQIYKNAYSIEYMWENHLPPFVYKYHDLMYREFNIPVPLQMGTLLPFISSLCGPKTRGKWTTRESVINFFTLNIASSGTGKTICRTNLISRPLEYIMENIGAESFPDMEVNKFTRAGIEDKLKTTGGYCILTTDEGTGLFKDLKNKETKHESDLSLLNQLYDGKGDKTTLAQDKQRVIPKNSTSMCVSLQQDGFISGIQSLGYANWIDSGFSERFMVTASQPFRHKEPIKKKACKEMKQKYGNDFMGKVALAIYEYHKEQKITYILNDEAEEVYEAVVDKYNEQFNLKWSNSQEDEILDSQDKAEICVRSKATELIGRLTIILWIYSNAFECVHFGKDFKIPKKVSAACVVNADKIIRTSYAHSETFSSATFTDAGRTTTNLTKPKKTDNNRVLEGLIKSPSCVVNIRMLQKNHVRNMHMNLLKDELKSLQDEGFGTLCTSEDQRKMGTSEELGFHLQNVFFKPAPFNLDTKFITRLKDRDITEQYYLNQFRKEIDPDLVKCVLQFHPHVTDIYITQSLQGHVEPASMESLDGKVKSSLFGAKKSGKDTGSTKDKDVKKKKSQPSQSQDNNPTQSKKEKQRRKPLSPDENKENLSSKPSDTHKDDANSSTNESTLKHSDAETSTGNRTPDLFSSDIELSEGGNTSLSKNCYVPIKRIETKKITTDKKSNKVVTNEEKITISSRLPKSQSKTSSQGHNFTKRDFDDLENDSSFQEEHTSPVHVNVTVKRKLTNSTNTIQHECTEETTSTTQRPVRAATKKYKSKAVVASKSTVVPDSDSSVKSDKDSLAKKKQQCKMVIPDTSDDKSDFQNDKMPNKPKRVRRLSRKKRDEQSTQHKQSSSLKKK